LKMRSTCFLKILFLPTHPTVCSCSTNGCYSPGHQENIISLNASYFP
jgi:hypothetical protein